MALRGDNGGDGGQTKFVPNFYYARGLSDRLFFGFAVNSPYGLATEYDKDWVGRYHAIKSDLLTININPSLAYKLTDRFSVAAGFNIQYLDAELSSAIDFGTLDAIGYFAPLSLGLTPQMDDGYVTLKGDSWGYGFNFGLLYDVSPSTRVGLSYRSRVVHHVNGKADFSNVPSGLSVLPVFKDTDASTKLTLPDTLSMGFYHLLTDKLAVMGDITLTFWSVLDELRFSFDNPNQPDSVTTTKWGDSFRYSLGFSYYASERLTLRTGIAYDETPIKEARYRTPRIPDSDRLWTALGLGYSISEHFKVDIGYAHLFVNDPEIRKTPTGEDAVRGGLKGTYDASVDIISAQISWNF
ncbi:MAG: aromatic hydrocarbon degradation protein [Nitrospirae bacterium]|nr:MAG: aromatic hydrocarbon degradation protein [Nitrospirota bacterium]